MFKTFFKKNKLADFPRICPLQLEFTTNDIAGNAQKIIDCVQKIDADIFVTPALALNGGEVKNRWLDSDYAEQISDACKKIAQAAGNKAVLVSYAETDNITFRSAVTWLEGGGFRHIFHSIKTAQKLDFIEYKGFRVLVTLDELNEEVCKQINLESNAVDLIIMPNSQPFMSEKFYANKVKIDAKKLLEQNQKIEGFDVYPNLQLNDINFSYNYLELLRTYQKIALKFNANFVMVSTAGSIDEYVFMGSSCAFNRKGELVYLAPAIEAIDFANKPHLQCINWDQQAFSVIDDPEHPSYLVPEVDDLYKALVVSVKNYVAKYKFKGVVLGLSGGIDSALTLAIAVDAIGADKVHAVMLPYLYTSDVSKEDACTQTSWLGVKFDVIPINNMVNAFNTNLENVFVGYEQDVTEENIQARVRAVTLMAIANKKGLLLLATGNKSELATGYCTLYGDMAGGFAPLKDVFKTSVYDLAKYRNLLALYEGKNMVIPMRIIERAPSAELAPNQKDQDVLPPYLELDLILSLILAYRHDRQYFVDNNYQMDWVDKVFKLLKDSEFKRKQAAIGPIVSYSHL